MSAEGRGLVKPENTPAHLRLFVAILLPEGIKDGIEQAQSKLRQALTDVPVRWSRREQFHLTLRFLGQVQATSAPALTEALQLACQKFAALRLRVNRIGFFPHERLPRVVWVGIEDLHQQLPALQRAIQSATQKFTTEEPEGTFTGHVTLGRINRLARREAVCLANAVAPSRESVFGEWTASHIDVMRSELSSESAKHTSLAEIPLVQKAS